jgi:hypothetical protein
MARNDAVMFDGSDGARDEFEPLAIPVLLVPAGRRATLDLHERQVRIADK